MSNPNHPWCRDVRRDEAVRAAEDAAAAERTPLPDHRDLPAAVAELRERVARLEAAVAPAANAGGVAKPEPRGWLTAREREEVQWAADAAYDKQHPAEDTLRALLARSTPPRVKVPSQPAEFTLPAWNLCVSRWIAAIRAAGQEVEE